MIVEQEAAKKEATTTVLAKPSATAIDNTIVCGVLIDLTNTRVMDKNDEASNAAMANEVEPLIRDLASKQSTTSNEANSRDKGDHDVVIVYSTSSGRTPLNYA